MGLTGGDGAAAGTSPACTTTPTAGTGSSRRFVSANSEASGGAFAGCFAGVANTCYEGIAVTKGSSPFGPYHVYFVNADYNPSEPGYPYLLNDFAKIATTRDAFLLFYDEFPLNRPCPASAAACFNGVARIRVQQERAGTGFRSPCQREANPAFTVAIENMGTSRHRTEPAPPTICSSARDHVLVRSQFRRSPRTRPSTTTAMAALDSCSSSLDFYGAGDNRIAVFDWTGLRT